MIQVHFRIVLDGKDDFGSASINASVSGLLGPWDNLPEGSGPIAYVLFGSLDSKSVDVSMPYIGETDKATGPNRFVG
jgi:hypothetical protein